jgi:hypothetical protein
MPIFFRRSTTMSQEIVGPLTITSALGVQGGSLELGATLDVAPETPYMDFHFGLGAAQDYKPTVCPSVASRNPLLYQSLPIIIPFRDARLRRRKDGTDVDTTARGVVERLHRFP